MNDHRRSFVQEALEASSGTPEHRARMRQERQRAPKVVGRSDDKPRQVKPAVLITPDHWPHEAPPETEFVADQRIPREDVTILTGDGGTGKTDLATQLSANVARSAPHWIGLPIQSGRVVFISAEEPEQRIRQRLWINAKREDYDVWSLTDLHLWFPTDKDPDTILAAADRRGIMQPTPLFRAIEASIASIGPVLVVVDNIAATCAGNQNERVTARSYVNLWRGIARQPSRPAVLLLDHPSLSGLTNGTGRGGNMDWWSGPRSVLGLRLADDKLEADQGFRILETVKSNCANRGKETAIRLQWTAGRLALQAPVSSLRRLAKDQECETVFLQLLDEWTGQGRNVSDKGPTYAPAAFSKAIDQMINDRMRRSRANQLADARAVYGQSHTRGPQGNRAERRPHSLEH